MSLRILAIEPYYGGSHRAFLDGLAAASRHDWTVVGLPARKWKWRMRGAALHVARQLDQPFDVLFATDFLDLATLVGLAPQRLAGVPKAVYFHENQLTYPVLHESERDYQFAFTNITTCLAADRVLFNSQFHRESLSEGFGYVSVLRIGRGFQKDLEILDGRDAISGIEELDEGTIPKRCRKTRFSA